MGCHPDRGIALARALTEAVQSRLTMLAGARDDLPRSAYARLDAGMSKDRGDVEKAVVATRGFSEVITFESVAVEDDVDWLLGRLESAGLDQIIAVDLTNSRIALPVVRVIIPGLEGPHDVPGYVPGPRARRAAGKAALP